jgi:hypothetical protein
MPHGFARLQDAEKARQRRSRFPQRLNVQDGVRVASSLAAALLATFLNILQDVRLLFPTYSPSNSRRAEMIFRRLLDSKRETMSLAPLPLTPNPSRFTLYGFIRLIRQSIEDRLKLTACRLQGLFIGISRYPDRGTPQIETTGPWVRDHEPIPAREKFFFEQPKANGTIGSPVAFAS